MSPIEHLGEAERLLGWALGDGSESRFGRELLVAAAQVHATLALAGINALTVTSTYVGDSHDITDLARIVQPKSFEQEPCTDGCVDRGRNGCYARCIEAKNNAKPIDMECPF